MTGAGRISGQATLRFFSLSPIKTPLIIMDGGRPRIEELEQEPLLVLGMGLTRRSNAWNAAVMADFQEGTWRSPAAF